MGYSGRMVVARADHPLTGSEALAHVRVLHEEDLGGGWRFLQLDGDLRGAARTFVDQTGAPVVTAFIIDSSVADVSALTPGGLTWRAYLHETSALQMGAPALDTPRDDLVRQAQAWSAQAGLTASESALRTAFDAHNTFAEETFNQLLAALGVLPVK